MMQNNKTVKVNSKQDIFVEDIPITATGKQPVNYLGEVAVKLIKGNTTIAEKTYTNSGMPNLFKFICNALAGNYTPANAPCQIRLFHFEKANDSDEKQRVTPINFKWDSYYADLDAATPYILYDTTPKVKYINTEDNKHYTTTYHFRIPFTLISENTIHAVGFFPSNVISPEDEICAYYLFTKEEDSFNGKETVWDPITLPASALGSYSIIVDWTMAVMNKSTTGSQGGTN